MLTRDGTAEPVSRDQILRHERILENIHFPCSADHVQDLDLTRLIPTLVVLVCVTIHTWYILCMVYCVHGTYCTWCKPYMVHNCTWCIQ